MDAFGVVLRSSVVDDLLGKCVRLCSGGPMASKCPLIYANFRERPLRFSEDWQSLGAKKSKELKLDQYPNEGRAEAG